eukprot:TRINITY_DN120976_c0_g1_i1.p2 TRINITY_DN120976_c0_g1~~TRINITY_DN120976_c0_g1_i1.p2  ORF type:complete len:155 (-),score=50.96 TRINITY_DN120976_c0_g1_i1:101-565(-)
MVASAAPKVAVPVSKWTAAVYGSPDACLAKTETSALPQMQFDPSHWSAAYNQCIGRGLSHKDCVAALPDDARLSPQGPLAGGSKEMASAIDCMTQGGDAEKCIKHFDTLAKLAGYEEPVIKSSTQKATEFCGKAGWSLLAAPVLFFGMRYVKIK